VGAPSAGPHGTGRTYVYKGLDAKPAFILESDETGGAFGAMFMSVLGDVDGDKTHDLYVSDWANSAKGRSTGRAYVYSGTDGHLLFNMTGEAAGDGFGIGVADAGDVDGDGAIDFLVTSAWSGVNGFQSGRVFVIAGTKPARQPNGRVR
jgi:hypothetical protein